MLCSQQVGGLVRVVLPGDSSFSLVQSVFRDAKSGAATAVRTPTLSRLRSNPYGPWFRSLVPSAERSFLLYTHMTLYKAQSTHRWGHSSLARP